MAWYVCVSNLLVTFHRQLHPHTVINCPLLYYDPNQWIPYSAVLLQPRPFARLIDVHITTFLNNVCFSVVVFVLYFFHIIQWLFAFQQFTVQFQIKMSDTSSTTSKKTLEGAGRALFLSALQCSIFGFAPVVNNNATERSKLSIVCLILFKWKCASDWIPIYFKNSSSFRFDIVMM